MKKLIIAFALCVSMFNVSSASAAVPNHHVICASLMSMCFLPPCDERPPPLSSRTWPMI